MLLTHLIRRGAELAGDKTALVLGDRKTSYGQLRDQVACLAGALVEGGVNSGDRVAILGLNSDRGIIGFFAAMWAGAIPLFANNRWSEDELVAAFDDCGARVLLFDEHFSATSSSLNERCKSLQLLISLCDSEPGNLPAGCVHIDDLLAKGRPIDDRCADKMASAFINYTGGTTGMSKGVVHDHMAFSAAMMVCKAEGFFATGTTLLVVPLYHISGMICMMSCLVSGETLVIAPAFDPSAIPDMIEQHTIRQLFMVPTMLRMTLDAPGFDAAKLGSVEGIRYGGSPMELKLLRELTELLPDVDFMQVYGQTEGLPITCLHAADHSPAPSNVVLGSVGQACLGMDFRIVDTEGRTVPAAGVPGEVSVRGAGVMQGYWDRPELTRQTLRDGWLMTGDIGYVDDSGYLFLVDRAKDMIISGGENVYSTEVEKAILAHELVAACAVVGLPDRTWGERVHAEIVLSEPHEKIEDELDKLCREKIAGYKCPKSYSVTDALPLTAVGKIDKVAIRAKYETADSSS